MKKLLAFLVLLTLSVGSLSACQNKPAVKDANASVETPPATTATAELDLSKVVLKIGAASAANGQAILEAAGLADTPYKVEFVVFQGGNLVLEAMAANQIDLGTGSQIPPIFASQGQNQGNLKIIATKKATTLFQELVIPEGSAIKSVSDLKGKKVAYVKSTTAHYFLAKMLKEAGVNWNEVETIPLSTSDGLTALLTNEVDALASYGNAIRSAHAKGATTLQSAANILSGDFYWYATPDAIADPAKHAAIVDYLSRFNEGNEYARNNADKWAGFYAPQINQEKSEYLKDFLEENEQAKVKIVPIDEATIKSEQDIVDTFIEIGLLKGPIDIRTLFDRSFDDEISKFKQN